MIMTRLIEIGVKILLPANNVRISKLEVGHP